LLNVEFGAMSLRQSIINDRLEELITSSGDEPDMAFMKFVYATINYGDYEDLQPEDVVDGGQDKQIDVLAIEEDSATDTANIIVLQTKNGDSFSSNMLTLMGNGLSWIFEKPRAEYHTLSNKPFVRKIDDVREFRNRLGPSNMRIRAFFVTKGDTQNLSQEFKQERAQIVQKYTNGGFQSFTFAILGASELVDFLEIKEQRQKQIDDQLPILYDRNKPSFIRYSERGVAGYICTVAGKEIARLVGGDREKTIFDLNLRRFYGVERGRVNAEIAATATNENESFKFWFFNNGITIVCDSCDVVDDPDSTHLKLKNLQIVNGCQTSMTLAAMAIKGQLRDDVQVLVKVFVTDEESFVDRIVLTTNNQNAISSRDLKANDTVQMDYQRAFKEIYGLRYERKSREYRGLNREDTRQVVSNEKAGQAFLAIVKKKPTIARTQKYRVWHQDWYTQLFPNVTVEKHLLAYLIYDYCLRLKKESLVRWRDDPIRYSIVSYGVFHLARVLAFTFTDTDNWNDTGQTNEWIKQIQDRPNVLRKHYGKSVTLIRKLIKRKADWIENINNAFKSTTLETAINKELHKPVG
jgi:hypothetical protein